MNERLRREIAMEVARALRAMACAAQDLRAVHARIKADLMDRAPGGEEERMALELGRTIGHLSEALHDAPQQLWEILMEADTVGTEEVQSQVACQAARSGRAA